MNIHFLINVIMGIIGLALGGYIMPTARMKSAFMLAYGCLVFYRLYDPPTSWAGVDWIRHLVVFVGEISFFYFITTFCKKYIEVEDEQQVLLQTAIPLGVPQSDAQNIPAQESIDNNINNVQPTSINSASTVSVRTYQEETKQQSPDTTNSTLKTNQNLTSDVENQNTDNQNTAPQPNSNPKSFGGMFIPVTFMGSFTTIYTYGSAEGISHIFLAPTFMAIIAVVITRISGYASPYKSIAKLFTLAYALGVMLHVGEFFLQSHPIIQLSHEVQQNEEMFWFVISSLVFYYALYKYRLIMKKEHGQSKTV